MTDPAHLLGVAQFDVALSVERRYENERRYAKMYLIKNDTKGQLGMGFGQA